jgi:hypothetical protein
MSFRPSKLTMNVIRDHWRVVSTTHDTETPEVTLMLGYLDNRSTSQLIRDLEINKPAVMRLASTCDVLPSRWGEDLRQWAHESRSFQQHDWLNCWKVYWPGFDAWAIGTILLMILEMQMGIPSFTRTRDWTSKGETIKKVLRGLCRAHPGYRMDAAEALNLYSNGKNALIAAGSAGGDWIEQKHLSRPLV